ncbi:hypothetical protein NQ317_011820 [Molorchus minor]|uniref:Plancitoxin-1 n=1 Tax=Molorchus minor TaxID=1323400 RepID=A0ABQ9JGV1_9CUCU|nr:hypothetical protein NQ317_011820 [Molorchus minor]
MNMLLQICLLSNILFVNSLQCVDESNKPVDWFVGYKIPEIKHDSKLLNTGVAYVYMTSEDYGSWKFSNISINSTESIIANTLRGLYSNKKNFTFILYNDQPPNRKINKNKGHNKGVVMIDKSNTGFWLVHSVPHFPQIGRAYIYPKTGAKYGQSFLCISMNFINLNKVGIQLQYNEPEIYSKNIDLNLEASLPELVKVAQNVTINNAPWYHVLNLESLNGTLFTSFAKSKNFNKDLYEDLVAPSLGTDLFVETWLNGAGRLPSNCSKQFKVNNIKSVYISSANVSFSSTDDHSKWAVTPPSDSKNWICIGDINRAEHQKVRGGGTVCLNNKQLALDYKKSAPGPTGWDGTFTQASESPDTSGIVEELLMAFAGLLYIILPTVKLRLEEENWRNLLMQDNIFKDILV